MKAALTILTLILFTSCGIEMRVSSPHGEKLPEDTCETRWEFDMDSRECIPLAPTPGSTLPAETQVDDALQDIVNEYVRRSGKELPSALTYIKLTDRYEGTNIIGGCITFSSGNREVRIKRSYWNSQSLNKKKNLMFHELGHCVEDLDHTHGAGNGECAAQYEDDTVTVMDACDERSETKHVIANAEDWKSPHYHYGPYDHTRARDWMYGGTAESHDIFGNYGYYELHNEYSLLDVFADFFNE